MSDIHPSVIAVLEDYRRKIDKHGIVLVGDTDGDIPCVYTIGARKSGMPDIYITGMFKFSVLMEFMNNLCKELKGRFTMGRVPGVIGGDYKINLLPINGCEESFMLEHTHHAKRFYDIYPEYSNLGDNTPLFLQAVLPDLNGKYPFSNEYNDKLEQPIYCSQIGH